MIPQLDNRDAAEHSTLAHVQATVLQRVYIAPYEQEVGAGFHGQETRTGNVDAVGIAEVFDSSARCCLELP